MASTSTTVTSVDCEGPCCCRCKICSGDGWWSSYDITFPSCYGYKVCISGVLSYSTSTTGACDFASGKTFKVNPWSGNYDYGSTKGTGECAWYSDFETGGPPFYLYGRVELQTLLFPGGIYGPYILITFPSDPTFSRGRYVVESFNCRTGGTFSGEPVFNCPDGFYSSTSAPRFSSSITVTPSAGATWQQCGKNSDGTTYEESPPPLLISSTMTAASKPTVKKSLDVIPRPDRCDSYNGRDKLRTGCNGWLCAGKCELGIKECMPGGFCQACDKYAVDPDFIGQGPAGWAK